MSADSPVPVPSEPQPEVPPLPRPRLPATVDTTLADFSLRLQPLGREIRQFSRWIENTYLPEQRAESRKNADLPSDVPLEHGEAELATTGGDSELRGYPALADFLVQAGVETLELSLDLESNQVCDVLHALYCVRHLAGGGEVRFRDRLLRRDALWESLRSEDGAHLSCTTTRLDTRAGRLTIRNTYCPLTFSRMATAYMRRTSRFRDHRAFFLAAPRFGLAAMLLALLPTGLMVLVGSPPPGVVIAGIAVATLIGFATAVVFETIGAIQYDKEHQQKELARRHTDLLGASQRIGRDLDRARRIQGMFIPPDEVGLFPDRVAIAHTYVPEMAVGGDYYDLKRLAGDQLGIVFADVSGHGMSGAFITGIIKTTFELVDQAGLGPAEFAGEVNRVLDAFTPPDSFAALFVATYEVSSRQFAYTNAGHQPLPVCLHARTGVVQTLDDGLGLVAGARPESDYEQATTLMEPGDKLVLCTDGIIDSVDREGERFGQQRLTEVLADSTAASASEVLGRIMDAVSHHAGDTPQSDDQAVLILEVLD